MAKIEAIKILVLALNICLYNCLNMKIVAPYEPNHNGAEPCLTLCAGTTGKGTSFYTESSSMSRIDCHFIFS